MLGPFTFIFTLESEEFEKFEKWVEILKKKHSGFGSGRKKKSGSGRVAVTCQGLPISNFF